jgi:predicted nucleic acid-binding protein
MYRTTSKRLMLRSFDLAFQFGLQPYDCVYVALAEHRAVEFWTGDQRLYNSLHGAFAFIRGIGDYQRKRASP